MFSVSSETWTAIGAIAAVVVVPATAFGVWLQWRAHKQHRANAWTQDLAVWSSLRAWLGQSPDGRALLARLQVDPSSVAEEVIELLQGEPGVALSENDEARIAKLVAIGAADPDVHVPEPPVESGETLLRRLRTLDLTRDHPQSRPPGGALPRDR